MPDVTAAATDGAAHAPFMDGEIIASRVTVPPVTITVMSELRPAVFRHNTAPAGSSSVSSAAWSVTSKTVPAGQAVGIGVGAVLVIVQVRCCPAAIVPLQSLLNEVVKPASPVSVTLNVPGPNVTSVPVAEPGKLGGFGLLAVTCIVKLAGVTVAGLGPETIFITVNVAVVGVDVGGGVVLFAAADC